MPAPRRPRGPYPHTDDERAEMAAVLEWITDGEPLTTQAERDRHDRDRAFWEAGRGRPFEPSLN